jgi:hypothetical protein
MAQVYPRIANPFMPQGTPDKTNSPTPFYAPGEIGAAFNDQSTQGSYLRAKLDSGATSSTAVGAVAAGQLAYWKDQAAGIVTNDKNQCDVGPSGAINRVAGIFQLAVTAAPGVNGTDGNPIQYVCDLVIQKRAYPVSASGSFTIGTYAIADTTANTARVIGQATVTTAPVSQVIGVVASATVTNNLVPVDVNIGFVD